MIRILHIIFIVLISSCKAENKTDNAIDKFEAFINLFPSKELPLSIPCSNDYIRREIFDPNTTEHKPNVYKSIAKDDWPLLYDESAGKKGIDFRYAFKVMGADDFYGIIYIKDSINIDGLTDQSWLILNTYSRKGKLVSKLKLAGNHFDILEMFCGIPNEHEIETTSYTFLPTSDNSVDLVHAKKCVKKYEVTDTGLIKRLTMNIRDGYFKVNNSGCYEEVIH